MNREKMRVEAGLTPQPENLAELVEVIVGTSKQNGKFKKQKDEKSYIFYVGDIDSFYRDPRELQPATVPCMGKVAKQGFSNWNLSIFTSHFQEVAEPDDGYKVGERTDVYRVGYVFDWSKTRVDQASRFILKDFNDGHVKPGILAYEDYLDPDFFSTDYMNAIHEILRGSVADRRYLMDEIRGKGA